MEQNYTTFLYNSLSQADSQSYMQCKTPHKNALVQITTPYVTYNKIKLSRQIPK